jgi:hypothetical protein
VRLPRKIALMTGLRKLTSEVSETRRTAWIAAPQDPLSCYPENNIRTNCRESLHAARTSHRLARE